MYKIHKHLQKERNKITDKPFKYILIFIFFNITHKLLSDTCFFVFNTSIG